MKVTLLDTKTGEVRDCSSWLNFDASWWSEGNGSCDCNRAIAFDRGEEDYGEEQRLLLRLEEGVCLGSLRWLIVGVSGDLHGQTEAEVLAEVNERYFPKPILLTKHSDKIERFAKALDEWNTLNRGGPI